MSANAASRLWIDDRYRGAHGIGRYAQEVTRRLTLPWSPLGLDGAPARPLDFLRRLSPEARDGLVYSPGYGALVSARRQILTIHDLIHLQTDWPGRAKYLAYYNGVVRPVVRRNKVVLTVSETSKQAIQEWLNDDSVEVVNAGIGCSDAFTPDGPRAEAAEPYVLYVGNLRAHKNLPTVLRALAMISDVGLRAVVPSTETARLREAAELAGLPADRLRVSAGPTDAELAALYRGASATVMPSLLEGFGLPALESIMCGTPVIHWAGCAAVAETVGSRGVSVGGVRDEAGWAEAMSRLASEPARVIPPAVTEYRWDRIASDIEAVIRSELASDA